LKDGDFCVEAVPPLREAVDWALKAIVRLAGDGSTVEDGETPLSALKTLGHGILTDATVETVARFRALMSSSQAPGEPLAGELLKSGAEIVETVQKAIARAALE